MWRALDGMEFEISKRRKINFKIWESIQTPWVRLSQDKRTNFKILGAIQVIWVALYKMIHQRNWSPSPFWDFRPWTCMISTSIFIKYIYKKIPLLFSECECAYDSRFVYVLKYIAEFSFFILLFAFCINCNCIEQVKMYNDLVTKDSYGTTVVFVLFHGVVTNCLSFLLYFHTFYLVPLEIQIVEWSSYPSAVM